MVDSILDVVGSTPICVLRKTLYSSSLANVWVKLEMVNPGGSIKDRIARAMIHEVLERAEVEKDAVEVIEATSGNTGIGIALVAGSLQIRATIAMPSSASMERRRLMEALGAEVMLTDEEGGIREAINTVCEYVKRQTSTGRKRVIPLDQFCNPVNPQVHQRETAMEIVDFFDSIGERVDVFVAGVGTGGTISGVGKTLKEKYGTIIVGVEPEGCSALTDGKIGPHKIEGIGTGFIPKVLDATLLDKVEVVSYEDAVDTTKNLAKTEGILAGISSGANVFVSLAEAASMKKGNVVTVLPDSAERYLSLEDFS